jgi:polysaccharide export outer membrane protein
MRGSFDQLESSRSTTGDEAADPRAAFDDALRAMSQYRPSARARGESAARRSLLFTVAALLTSVIAIESATSQSTAKSGAIAAQGMTASALRPGDALRVRVWREPELSGEFTIDESGVVTLPKLGPVRAVDESVGALKARVIASYAAFITQPVEVTPLLRVRVLGAVRTPGLYRVEPIMTLADAIALAGGTTPEGSTGRVRLVRDGRTIDAALSPQAPLAESPLRSGDQLFVPERSWLSRNPGTVLGAVSATATLIWAIRRQ